MRTTSTASVFRSFSAVLSAGLVFLPAFAMAHAGHHGHHEAHGGTMGAWPSLADGLLHPITGLDHLLLALGLGWLLFSLGRSRVKLPALAFLTALAAGTLCGRFMSGGTGLEIAIALSVLAAGAMMLRGTAAKLGMLGLIAVPGGVAHGLAHGAEALPGASFAAYGLGLLVSTAVLLAAGGGMQALVARCSRPALALRTAGGCLVFAAVLSLVRLI